jgi:hypothetical protein
MHELLPQLHLGIPTSAETPKDSETLFLSFLDSRHLSSLSLSLSVSLCLSLVFRMQNAIIQTWEFSRWYSTNKIQQLYS